MNSTVNEITKSIIGKISLFETDTDELQQLTSQYPFFGPAQFLLAQKMKQDNSPLFTKQIQKASLYFQNPLWLDHLLSYTDTGNGQNQVTSKYDNAFFMPLVQMEIPATYEIVLDQTKTEHSNNTISEEQPEQNRPELFIKFPKFKFEPIDDTSETEVQAGNDEYPDQTKTEHIDDKIHQVQPEQNQPELSVVFPKFNVEPIDDTSETEVQAENDEYPDQTKTEHIDDKIHQVQPEQNQPELSVVFPKFNDEPIDDTSKTEVQAGNEEYPDQTTREHNDDKIHAKHSEQNQPELTVVFPKFNLERDNPSEVEGTATYEEVDDQPKHEQADGQMADDKEGQNLPELSVIFPKFNFEPIDPSKAELTFEPYHTIDYFASQGIRNKEEEKPKDQFTRQLKSFTEWLKIMKRLPVSEIAAAISATDEKKVEKMAEISINDREVVTEAMAEVWEKQGNKHKAIEVYQKLSLLIPSKSSYFAAKIEQLKIL